MSSYARELAASSPDWHRLVGRVAEDVARLLDDGGRRGRAMPTPASGRNRSAGRGTAGHSDSRAALRVTVGRRCSWCGAPTAGTRRTCGDRCRVSARQTQDKAAFYGSGPARARALRAEGVEPIDTEVRQRIGEQQRERQRQENEWNAAHPERADPELFRREVLPALEGVPLRELARRTGLSVPYCGQIRQGQMVPHERWWEALRSLVDPRGGVA